MEKKKTPAIEGFGTRIRQAMINANTNSGKLSLALGYNWNAIENIIARSTSGLPAAAKIADALHVSIDWLVFGETASESGTPHAVFIDIPTEPVHEEPAEEKEEEKPVQEEAPGIRDWGTLLRVIATPTRDEAGIKAQESYRNLLKLQGSGMEEGLKADLVRSYRNQMVADLESKPIDPHDIVGIKKTASPTTQKSNNKRGRPISLKRQGGN